jgi:hypothetical protein
LLSKAQFSLYLRFASAIYVSASAAFATEAMITQYASLSLMRNVGCAG